MKFVMPVEKMQQGPIVFPIAFLYFIGVCETLGGLGLILPGLTRIATFLTPLAAAGLTIIMIGATTVSIIGMRRRRRYLPGRHRCSHDRGSPTAGRRVVPLRIVPRRVLRAA